LKKKRIKVGVIGVGHLGEYHTQKYIAMPSVDLIGIMDINPERARDIGRKYNTNIYERHQELLNMVDAVSLAVPTEMHFQVARGILVSGVHLLIEKPITYSLEDAKELITIAKEKNLILQVGHVERFNPAVVKMESLLNDPIFIESHRMNLFTKRGTGVDVTLDLMIHDLDIILHVVPSDVKEVHATGMSVVTDKTDIANVRMIFENGTVANLTASRVSNRNLRKIRIFQPDAYISVDCLKREISVTSLLNENNDPDTFPQITSNKMKYPDSDPLADEISSFVDAVVNGSKPVVSGQDGKKALRVALNIIDQIETGCRGFKAIC